MGTSSRRQVVARRAGARVRRSTGALLGNLPTTRTAWWARADVYFAGMATMRVVQVAKAGGPFELVERPIPDPGPGTVRVKVEACGVCHSDVIVRQGALPVTYPRVPGHEVAGVVDALGAGVTGWTVGQRVGVGWNGGYDGVCAACRRGELFACVTRPVTGLSFDGGYADYMLAPAAALAAIPPSCRRSRRRP